MSFQAKVMWDVECDRCGESAGDGQEICAWTDKYSAIDRAVDDQGWIEYRGVFHYCADCITWNEDETVLIPKPK